MTDLRKAAEMALDALETVRPYEVADYDPLENAITALRQALAQPEQEQEPVAKVDITKKGYIAWLKHDGLEQDQLLYTAPPKPCVNRGLMEALKQIADETYDEWTNGAKAQRIAEAAIKAALKEKNHD